MILLNPKKHSRKYSDDISRQIMLKTIEFFEKKGKTRIKEDDRSKIWYADFIDFLKAENVFAELLTPTNYGSETSRWDTWRNQEFNEILGFYGLSYWYTWQVSTLGLSPIWMSNNEEAKHKAAKLLQEGAIFAFGLSEKEHGADVYSTEMSLAPQVDGTYKANGSKYYIGNANKALMISTLGKMSDTDDYTIFVTNSQHPTNFNLIKNTVNSQSYVAEFKLEDYPIEEKDILSKGQDAWDCTLNTVNIGKYNLGWGSIGLCTHALYEAINHASKRRLYKMFVTDFPHVQRMFTDAYVRLIGMKLFTQRTSDYMRVASLKDRRYLLYNPIVKMKVTTQGEEVIDLLWDVIAAKGFEKDTFFELATRDIRALPKLEGTVHVNIALIVKFLKNYMFIPSEYPEIGEQNKPVNDDFLFNQGPARGLSKITFHDYNIAYNKFDLPNIEIFKEQIMAFKTMLFTAPPLPEQQKDIDFLLSLGEIFTLIAYGQLILENAEIKNIEHDLVDQLFDCMVRDFSKYALDLYSKPSSTPEQMDFCKQMIRKPSEDTDRYQRVWKNHVYALKDEYEMNDKDLELKNQEVKVC